MTEGTTRTHLVIPDPHAKPGVNNRRFDWLGKFIADTKPTTVVCLGDMADMESLSTYDKGKRGYEGRRYKRDVAATIEALERISRHLPKKRPRMVMLEGNHEYRITRAIEEQAILDGTIGFDDLQYAEHGWEVTRYRGKTPGVHVIDGIAYAHYHVSGVMGKPISGEHPAYSMLAKRHMSCVAGHLHTWDACERNLADGRRIKALVAGCYMDPDQEESYAGNANAMWRRGVAVLEDVKDGDYDERWISIGRLRKAYK